MTLLNMAQVDENYRSFSCIFPKRDQINYCYIRIYFLELIENVFGFSSTNCFSSNAISLVVLFDAWSWSPLNFVKLFAVCRFAERSQIVINRNACVVKSRESIICLAHLFICFFKKQHVLSEFIHW